jgi:uncharacterized protein (DUF58 family)
MKHHTVLCREGIYYLGVLAIVFLGAMIRQVNLLLLFASLLACPPILAWRLAKVTTHGLSVRRRFPSHVFAGDPLLVQVELTNHRKRFSSWAIVVEDRIQSRTVEQTKDQASFRPAVYFEHIAPGESHKKTYTGYLPRRGRYQIGDMRISTRFPFGFFRRVLSAGDKKSFIVFPRLGELASGWITKQHEASESLQRKRYRPSRVSGEFLGVRQWQMGDSRRWVHWRSTAKHGEMVVRQFEQNQNRDAAVLIDLWEPTKPNGKVKENVELAVSFAATLVNLIARQGGCNLSLGTIDGQPELHTGPTSTPLVEQHLERLAMLEPHREDHLCDLLLIALAQTEPNADLILVSHRPVALSDPHRFEQLRNDPRLRSLAQRLRIVDTSDPALDEFFRANPAPAN